MHRSYFTSGHPNWSREKTSDAEDQEQIAVAADEATRGRVDLSALENDKSRDKVAIMHMYF